MDWSELARTTCWTPLVRVCKDAVPIAEWLYQIDSNQYVLALPTNSASQKGLPDAPFVTLGYWAETSEAIQRVVLRDDTKQVPNVRHPPLDLQLGTNGWRASQCNRVGAAPVNEAAV